MSDTKNLFKLVLVGDSGVGKTCLFRRFVENKFMEHSTASIGVDCELKTITLDGRTVNVQIWDTAGQERYRSITPWYYRDADGIIIVYDCTNQATFNNLKNWLEEIDRRADENVCKLLIGNKTDLNTKVVDTSTAERFAKQHNMPFLETSSKDATNVEQAFKMIVSNVNNRRSSTQNGVLSRDAITLPEGNDNRESTSSCCVSNWGSYLISKLYWR